MVFAPFLKENTRTPSNKALPIHATRYHLALKDSTVWPTDMTQRLRYGETHSMLIYKMQNSPKVS